MLNRSTYQSNRTYFILSPYFLEDEIVMGQSLIRNQWELKGLGLETSFFRAMDNKILEAIKAGEAVFAEKKEIERLKELKRALEHEEYKKEAVIKADKWTKEELPAIIEKITAEGRKREFYIGSSDYGNADILVIYKAQAAEKLGLRTRVESYRESPGDEGAYAHGAGSSYYIVW